MASLRCRAQSQNSKRQNRTIVFHMTSSPNPTQERVLPWRVSKTHAKTCNPLTRNRYRYLGFSNEPLPRLVCKECRRVPPRVVMGFTLRTQTRILRRGCASTLCRS